MGREAATAGDNVYCPRIATKGATATSTLALNHLKTKEDCYSLHLLTRMCPIYKKWGLKGDIQRFEVSPWQRLQEREVAGIWQYHQKDTENQLRFHFSRYVESPNNNNSISSWHPRHFAVWSLNQQHQHQLGTC